MQVEVVDNLSMVNEFVAVHDPKFFGISRRQVGEVRIEKDISVCFSSILNESEFNELLVYSREVGQDYWFLAPVTKITKYKYKDYLSIRFEAKLPELPRPILVKRMGLCSIGKVVWLQRCINNYKSEDEISLCIDFFNKMETPV